MSLLPNIPPRYCVAIEKVVLPPRVKGWRGDPWSVSIAGPLGTGKSSMAAALARDVLGDEEVGIESVTWVNCTQLAVLLRAEIGEDGREHRIASNLARAQFLVLDDLTAARGTEYVKETLRHILCQRYDNCLPTIVTMDSAELEPRIASRLAEGAVVKLSGPDRRRGGRA